MMFLVMLLRFVRKWLIGLSLVGVLQGMILASSFHPIVAGILLVPGLYCIFRIGKETETFLRFWPNYLSIIHPNYVAPTVRETEGPSRIAQYLLFLVPRKYRENLVGDLEEEYRTRLLPVYGRRWAALWYWCQVISSCGPLVLDVLKRLLGLAAVWKLIR